MMADLIVMESLWMVLLLIDEVVTHLELLLLAGDSCGEASHELHKLWDLVVRNLVLAKGQHIVWLHVTALAQLYQSNGLLTVLWVGDTNNLHIVHSRHLSQVLLDLLWVYVLASSDNHILHSTHNSAVTVFIEYTNISGFHPPVDYGFLCSFFITPIANHHSLASDQHFSGMSNWYSFTLFIDYLGLQPRMNPTYRLSLLNDRVRRVGLERDWGCLCHSITDGDILNVQLFDDSVHEDLRT